MANVKKVKDAIVKVGKKASGQEKDVLNALAVLLTKNELGDAKDIWSDFVAPETKKAIIKAAPDTKKLLGESEAAFTGLRATKAGRIDFRTRVGKKTAEYIKKVAGEYTEEPEEPETDNISHSDINGSDSDINLDADLGEKLVRRVSADGTKRKTHDAKTRKRRANQNSKLSRSQRKRIARKAAKTRGRDKAGLRKAAKKRRKANKKRKALGLS